MNIIIINKEIFQNRPPVISTLLTLSDLGHNVTLITVEINDYWSSELQKKNISFYVVSEKKNANRIAKVFEYLNFKNQVFKYLTKKGINNDNALLWVIGGNTIFSLGDSLNKYRYVLQIQELHENDKHYLRAFSKVINNAELVFMNEYNRTILYQIWFMMKKRAIVLPNKPFFLPNKKDIQNHILPRIKQQYEEEIELFKTKKVILFQGWYGKPDRDLTAFVQAIKELGDDYRMAILGRYNKNLDEYRAIDPNIIHIDFIPAPDYLVFTSLAYIGIVSYNPNSLNNAYCAPNKIWEYSTFSLPMLCNDIPGLKYTVEYSGAGICVDENNTKAIFEAILQIDMDYYKYSNNATQMNNNFNNAEIIRNAMLSIEPTINP